MSLFNLYSTSAALPAVSKQADSERVMFSGAAEDKMGRVSIWLFICDVLLLMAKTVLLFFRDSIIPTNFYYWTNIDKNLDQLWFQMFLELATLLPCVTGSSCAFLCIPVLSCAFSMHPNWPMLDIISQSPAIL